MPGKKAGQSPCPGALKSSVVGSVESWLDRSIQPDGRLGRGPLGNPGEQADYQFIASIPDTFRINPYYRKFTGSMVSYLMSTGHCNSSLVLTEQSPIHSEMTLGTDL
jgi:hypothetical protein